LFVGNGSKQLRPSSAQSRSRPSKTEGLDNQQPLRGSGTVRPKQLGVLAEQEMIGHAGDVVTDDAKLGGPVREFVVGPGHCFRMVDVIIEEFGQGFDGAFAIADDRRLVVKAGDEEFLEGRILGSDRCAESC
jgi:hypothetical protein